MRFIVFAFICIFVSGFGQTYFISIFNETWLQTFDLTKTQLGVLYSCATLGSAISIFFVGPLLDRVTYLSFSIAVSLGLCAAALVTAFAPNPAALLIGLYGLRLCGQGLLRHIASTIIGKEFQANRGRALAVSMLGVPASEIILPLIAINGLFGTDNSSQWLAAAAMIAIIMIPTFYLFSNDLQNEIKTTHAKPADSDATDDPNQFSRLQILKDPLFLLILPTVLAVPFIMTSYFYIQKSMFVDFKWDLSYLNYAFPTYAITSVISGLNAGVLIDIFTARKLLPFMLIPLSFALLLLGLAPSPNNLLGAMALFGLASGACGIILNAYWAETYPAEILGTVKSVVVSILIFSTACAPALVGATLDFEFSYESLFLCLFGYTIVAISLAFARSLKASSAPRPSEKTL